MKRIAITVLACALALSSPAMAQLYNGWGGTEFGAAVDDQTKVGLRLTVLCNEGRMYAALHSTLADMGTASDPRREEARLFQGVRSITLTIERPKGSTSIVLVPGADLSSFTKALTARELADIEHASRIVATSPKWRATFLGRNALREIGVLRCPA